MSIATDLLHMINSEVSLDPSVEIDLDTDLLLTGLVDSLGVVEIVAYLEDANDIEIDVIEVVIENFQTPAKMVALVERLKGPTG